LLDSLDANSEARKCQTLNKAQQSFCLHGISASLANLAERSGMLKDGQPDRKHLKVKLALESRVFAASGQGHTAGRSATGLHMSPVKHRDVPQEVAKTVL